MDFLSEIRSRIFVKKYARVQNGALLGLEQKGGGISHVIACLREQKIPYKIMGDTRTQDFKELWVQKLTEGRDCRLSPRKICLNTKRSHNYLWHLFSYKVLLPEEGMDAVVDFLNAKKNDCFLYLSLEDTLILLRDVERLKLSFLKECQDVVVTDSEFTWTFALTHERELGPYFFRIDQESDKRVF